MKKELTPEVVTGDKEIDEVIKDCIWRENVQGVSFCGGMLGACARVIDSGHCDTLRCYFQGKDAAWDYWVPMEEEEENESIRGEDK